jgi:N-acetylneuraminic acid mutarotase
LRRTGMRCRARAATIGFLTSIGDLNMKRDRSALVGALPAFILLVCVQLNARAACTPPPLPDMQSWFSGDNTTNGHIWQPVGTLDNHATDATAKSTALFQLRQLSFADRVAYQRAIEEVYWRHRIWPKQRPDPKPSLDAGMSQAAIKQKVQDYLRNSELLEEGWQKPLTPEQLQAEMERMAQHTRQPEVLRELFAALGNDPFVIAECLARPVLLERLQFATDESRKEPLEPWSATAQDQVPNVMAAANANYTLPGISDQPSDCTDDSWTATTIIDVPKQRDEHTAVWTGSEMIVWGGQFHGDHDIFNLDTGGKYAPSTDSWTPTSTTNAPSARVVHTAVWTGTEMIVWGGANSRGSLDTGGRYNPSTDSWTATSTTNAPTGRGHHTAVWTGSEMIVWGGFGPVGQTFKFLNTGGRYNPDTDSWAATSTSNAPSARSQHTAVWTGSEMIVWGGAGFTTPDTGGRYNPGTDSWMATSTTNAPIGRVQHTAVWTGTEMIVWGGYDNSASLFQSGGRYNPGTDSWTATSTTNAPTGRSNLIAVWTGSEMIVWGGFDTTFNYVNTGGRYNPSTDSWTATSTTDAPTGRYLHTAVWTGSEMVVWGGEDYPVDLNTGGRYCAQAGPAITLDTAARKVAGINTVGLTWSGATSTDIDVYRDSVLIVTTANDGSYRDSTGDTGRARYTYQVCEAGSQACSNEASVAFLR